MNSEENSFIREVKAAMQRLGMNQSQLARAMETQPGVITRWMQGQTPRLESMRKIAHVLNIPLASLIYNTHPQTLSDKPREVTILPHDAISVSEPPHRYHSSFGDTSNWAAKAIEQTLDEIRTRLMTMSRSPTPAEREMLQKQCITRIEEFNTLCAVNM